MFKRSFYILIFILATQFSAFAGEFEKLVASYDKIFLYLYTPECSYCEKFNPIYEKVFNKHLNKCKFVKINANTKQGNELMRAVNGYYVPFVLLIDSSTRQIRRIDTNCLLNFSCVNNAVENLVN